MFYLKFTTFNQPFKNNLLAKIYIKLVLGLFSYNYQNYR